jgi:hypothetical protein
VSALRDSVAAAPASRDRTFDRALLDVKAWMAPSGGGRRDDDEDDDDDVAVVSSTVTVSLRDPISLARIAVPARGKNCRHVPCFDLDTILEFAGSSAGAGIKCPICRRINMLPELYVDSFMHRLLQEVPESVTSVEVDAHGQWHVPPPQSVLHATATARPSRSCTLDLDPPDQAATPSTLHSTPGACAAPPRPCCSPLGPLVDLSHAEDDADVDLAHVQLPLLADLYSPASIAFVERTLTSAGRSTAASRAASSRRRARTAVPGLSDEVESSPAQRRHVAVSPVDTATSDRPLCGRT